MPEIESSYLYKKDLYVDKVFKFGEVYYIKDSLIDLPESDRINARNMHNGRRVVIISNNDHNSDKFSPVILVAPLSSQIHLVRKYDIELNKGLDAVKDDSIAMLELIQPVCKADIERCCGEVREEKKIAILDSVLEILGQ